MSTVLQMSDQMIGLAPGASRWNVWWRKGRRQAAAVSGGVIAVLALGGILRSAAHSVGQRGRGEGEASDGFGTSQHGKNSGMQTSSDKYGATVGRRTSGSKPGEWRLGELHKNCEDTCLKNSWQDGMAHARTKCDGDEFFGRLAEQDDWWGMSALVEKAGNIICSSVYTGYSIESKDVPCVYRFDGNNHCLNLRVEEWKYKADETMFCRSPAAPGSQRLCWCIYDYHFSVPKCISRCDYVCLKLTEGPGRYSYWRTLVNDGSSYPGYHGVTRCRYLCEIRCSHQRNDKDLTSEEIRVGQLAFPNGPPSLA